MDKPDSFSLLYVAGKLLNDIANDGNFCDEARVMKNVAQWLIEEAKL